MMLTTVVGWVVMVMPPILDWIVSIDPLHPRRAKGRKGRQALAPDARSGAHPGEPGTHAHLGNRGTIRGHRTDRPRDGSGRLAALWVGCGNPNGPERAPKPCGSGRRCWGRWRDSDGRA